MTDKTMHKAFRDNLLVEKRLITYNAGLTLVDRIVATCELIFHFAKETKLRLATFANLYC